MREITFVFLVESRWQGKQREEDKMEVRKIQKSFSASNKTDKLIIQQKREEEEEEGNSELSRQRM